MPLVPDLAFRPAASSDVDAVVQLVTAAYRGEASTAGWTTEHHLLHGQRTDAAMVAAALAAPTGEVILAEATDGTLVGCIHVERSGGAAHFGMFAVDPARQAGGTGSALLSRAEERAREWGCATMDLEVIGQRRELIAWYERRGYTRTGDTTPFPYGDERFGLPQRDDLHFVVLRREL